MTARGKQLDHCYIGATEEEQKQVLCVAYYLSIQYGFNRHIYHEYHLRTAFKFCRISPTNNNKKKNKHRLGSSTPKKTMDCPQLG